MRLPVPCQKIDLVGDLSPLQRKKERRLEREREEEKEKIRESRWVVLMLRERKGARDGIRIL